MPKTQGNILVPLLVVVSVLLILTIVIVSIFFWSTQKNLISKSVTDSPILSTSPKFSSASDPNIAWETYENNDFGFSFKHPTLDSQCCNISGPLGETVTGLVTFAQKSAGHQGTDEALNGFAIYVDQPSINLSQPEGFRSYITDQKAKLLQNFKDFTGKVSNIHSEEKVMIGNKEGTLLKGFAWWADALYFVPLDDDKSILVIVKTQMGEGSFKEFDQILSTVKFDPSWRYYANQGLGLSLSYPAGWEKNDLTNGKPYGVIFSGSEGSVEIDFRGSQEPDNCDGMAELSTKAGGLNFCLDLESGHETLTLSRKDPTSPEFPNVRIKAKVNAPISPINEDVIHKVLATISYL